MRLGKCCEGLERRFSVETVSVSSPYVVYFALKPCELVGTNI